MADDATACPAPITAPSCALDAFVDGTLIDGTRIAFAIGRLVIDAGADDGTLIDGTRIPARIPFEAAPKRLQPEIRGEESRWDLE